MRYWLTRLIYYIRRLIPLYANDNSRIYSAYSAQLLEQLCVPALSVEDRYTKFLHFSEHFIGDVSGERLAMALHRLGEPLSIINGFDTRIKTSAQPRASILLRKTKAVLAQDYGLSVKEHPALDFIWSEAQEEAFKPSLNNAKLSSPMDYLKRPYQLWRVFFRSKQTSLLGSPLRRHYLKRLSSVHTPDALWLKTFEDYSKLFNTPADILIMAENLKFRHPARDLALLDFTYRVRYKKPKALLFHRRMRLALASTLNQELPEYRGTELTKIFFNPLEEGRLKARERRNKKLKAAAKAKAEKREQKRKKLVEKSLKRREKILKARAKKRAPKKDSLGAKVVGYSIALIMPVKIIVFRLLKIGIIDEHNPVQVVVKPSEPDTKRFQYISPNRRSLRDNPSLAIFSVTGRLDPYLDLSLLADFSKIVILNATALKDAALKEAVQEQLGIDIELECFSPAQFLIKPYTQDHKTISDFSDKLAQKITSRVSSHRALSTYYEPDLTEEYALTLSDKVFRHVERFYAASLFFKTVEKTTPVFFNSVQNNFQFTLAKAGFSKIVVFGGARLLGKSRSAKPISRHIHPRVWYRPLLGAFNSMNKDIRDAVSSHENTKTESILIATHSRSSLHKASAAMLREDLTQSYNTQTLDLAPQAATTEDKQNIYGLTHKMDRKLTSTLQTALLPSVTQALSELSLQDYDVLDMVGDIAIIAARNAGTLMGHTALYRAVKDEYKGRKAAAILVPGRYADIRAIARAFHALNLPTIDIQLLFLSTMARYKAPIATHNAVIDTVTRDFYQQSYGIEASRIRVIGSIMRDDDIKRAKKLGRATSLKQLGFTPHAQVITLACQPGFETATYEAVKALVSYLAEHPKVSLVIKLHPAQSPEHKAALAALLEVNKSPDIARRWRVIHKEPFWSIIPATTILMSYFSNVCLQACAFAIPVLSLPGGGTRPDPDFETIGLARNVTELAKLPAQLDYILGLSKAAQRREAPFAYIEQNPHMAGHDALGNLRAVLTQLMTP